jgi:hypothetical protein
MILPLDLNDYFVAPRLSSDKIKPVNGLGSDPN